ncbi:wax ester/triacylglycerol synthase family O-acyltransferase [Nocardia puris]|uniref:Diacylglycerol O-acyltransferase n=1 Tax=Nocardia puris TaxID=208602 RepID=A0A366DNB4_9NOCA|nr:wax ester/triacylglycerol synthase family O-acyltransferase [Nocardia puris]MBF6213575.1 wax ester/triacylglycerol synthase family O-acyltransferase [Nocardia puris]MBF6365495.1 wax ester/triacylglycerol synthase family O-acyltransferase [Nocardia puris]MBF6459961.1 wax ester/triacylglycerol synthase family O-acyltransferase [Nocardia puris]RBO91556.1 diacylglycerol O-acyltransferase [Nocardia puris]
MKLIAPIDAIFLLAESREHPMHVGSLQLFEPPEDAGPDFAAQTHRMLLSCNEIHPTFRKRPATALGSPQLAWTLADDVDTDYHVRRVALPGPGTQDQLVDLISGLHGTLLDRHRPLWEVHVIEGLRDGRFAIYSKMHHGLIDGVSAQRLVQRTLTEDPNATEPRIPWNLPRSGRRREREAGGGLLGAAKTLAQAAGGVPGLLRAARTALVEQQATLPFAAPRTMLNVPIGGARRTAVRSWPMERIKQVRKATGTTVNDVVLAMSAGALRTYLAEHDALPDKPLVAMVPMSLRSPDDTATDGVKVGALLCNLGTDLADPLARLRVVSESMRSSKQVYDGLSPLQSMALSGLMVSPIALNLIPALIPWTTPPFNVVISNVPGPREQMYWNGARLDANFPLSIPFDGQAVNITLTTNGGNLDFGLVGCRRTVSDLHRILDHLETALAELEAAV